MFQEIGCLAPWGVMLERPPTRFSPAHCARSATNWPVSGFQEFRVISRAEGRDDLGGLILGTGPRRMNRGSATINARPCQAASDHRRRDPRLRAQRLLQLARLGHRARGRNRERHDLPLLQDQGRHPRHALPREDGRVGGARPEGDRHGARSSREDPQDRRAPLQGDPGEPRPRRGRPGRAPPGAEVLPRRLRPRSLRLFRRDPVRARGGAQRRARLGGGRRRRAVRDHHGGGRQDLLRGRRPRLGVLRRQRGHLHPLRQQRDAEDRAFPEAGDRRHQRPRPRRRLRDRDGMPLPAAEGDGPDGADRVEPRDHPGLRRHPADAAPHRADEGARVPDPRHPDSGAGVPGPRAREPAVQGRRDAQRRQGARAADRQAPADRHAPDHRGGGRGARGADRQGERPRGARVPESAQDGGRLGGDPGLIRQPRAEPHGEEWVGPGIRDRVALGTGGALSLGKADALTLAAEGCKIAIADLNAEGAAEAAREIEASSGRARGYACDIRDAGQVQETVARIERDLGPVDILVNNAGMIYTVGQLKDMRDEDWELNLGVNLTGTYKMTKAVFPGMRERRWGRIVCMASIAGLMGGFGQTAYATTKIGVIGFAKSVALEGARYNVTYNAIAPGIIAPNAKLSPLYDRMVKRVAMQREGEPEDVASAVLFLCSERARYITGAVLTVTGGMDLFTF